MLVSSYSQCMSSSCSECCSEHHYDLPVSRLDEAAQVAVFLGVLCRVIMGVSRAAADLILGLLGVIVAMVGRDSPSQSHVYTQIPTTAAAALAQFNLEGRTTVYANCSKCHCNYAPTYTSSSALPSYPSHCTNRPQPDSAECGEPLLRVGSDGTTKPIRTFVYHQLIDFLASLLARPDLEGIMDKCCDDTFVSVQRDWLPTMVTNPFEANYHFRTPLTPTL